MQSRNESIPTFNLNGAKEVDLVSQIGARFTPYLFVIGKNDLSYFSLGVVESNRLNSVQDINSLYYYLFTYLERIRSER
jgi:hypothetical protein